MKYRFPRLTEIFLFGAAFFICFFKLDLHPPERWDELTNARVVYELNRSSNPLILTYHRAPFFEKPPLWYWITSLITKIFGFSLTTLRLVSALSGFLIIILMYGLTRVFYSRNAAIYSVLILLSAGQLFIPNAGGFFSTHHFRSADPDSLLVLLIMLSYIFFFLSDKKNTIFLIPASIFTALGSLTKGPMSLLPSAVWILYRVFKRPAKGVRLKFIFISVLIFILIFLPWNAYMIFHFRQTFINAHFVYNYLNRAISPLEGHNGGWIYYLRLFTDNRIYPFSGLLIASLFYLMFNRQFIKNILYFYPAAMVAGVFITVFAVRTTLSWYILPVYPFAAMLTGAMMDLAISRLLVMPDTPANKIARFLFIGFAAAALIYFPMRNLTGAIF